MLSFLDSMNDGSGRTGGTIMRRFATILCVSLFALCLANIARADDQIDNPAYKSWAKFNKGTSVTYSTQATTMGNTSNITTTETLMDVTPDAVTVQMSLSMVVAGNTMNMPGQTQTIPAKITKPADAATTQPVDASATTATEDVQAAGKTFSCKKTTATLNQNGMTATTTSWMCDDVPGSMVKMQSNSTGSMTATTSMMLTAIDVK